MLGTSFNWHQIWAKHRAEKVEPMQHKLTMRCVALTLPSIYRPQHCDPCRIPTFSEVPSTMLRVIHYVIARPAPRPPISDRPSRWPMGVSYVCSNTVNEHTHVLTHIVLEIDPLVILKYIVDPIPSRAS